MGIGNGSRVRWTTSTGATGSGSVFTDPEDGHVLVSVDAASGEEHRVIRCALTWLSII